MKYMIISDIHGDIYNLNKVLDIYLKEGCNKLIILGDLFNYGIDLNREDIINRLNLIKDNVIYIRGNCDNNINGILFNSPYMKEIELNNKSTLLTHGHLYSKNYLLSCNYDIIISGHTHIASIEKENNKLFINPGSISKSRKGEKSFIILDNNYLYLKNIDNKVLLESKI